MEILQEERRQSSRRRVRLSAQYDSDSMGLSGFVVSISRSGLFLSSEFLDDHGSVVEIGLQLPGDPQPIQLAGRVVRIETRSHSAGMGVHFTDLSWQTRLSLARFVEDSRSQHAS